MTSQRRKRIKFWRWARRNRVTVSNLTIFYRKLWIRTVQCYWPSHFRIKFIPKGWERSMYQDAYIYKGEL